MSGTSQVFSGYMGRAFSNRSGVARVRWGRFGYSDLKGSRFLVAAALWELMVQLVHGLAARLGIRVGCEREDTRV